MGPCIIHTSARCFRAVGPHQIFSLLPYQRTPPCGCYSEQEVKFPANRPRTPQCACPRRALVAALAVRSLCGRGSPRRALAVRSRQPSPCARRAVAAALAGRSLCARNSASRSSDRRQPPENLTVRSFFDQGRRRLLRPRNRHRWIALS